MKQCTVSFVHTSGFRHSVELQADSMYEAATTALETFHEYECPPAVGSQLEIQVRSAVTQHTLAIKKLMDWADLAGGSPRDVILKGRMKRVMARQAVTRARNSRGDGRAG